MSHRNALLPAAPSSPEVSRSWVLVAMFLVLVFDPGIMSNDSVQSLRQARSFEFTDWHPPIMAMVWSVFDRIIPGPAGMLIAQAALYAYSAARLCAVAFPNLAGRTGRWVLVVAFSLFPPAMCIVGMMWKDIWMSGFLMLAMSHLFSLARAGAGERKLVSLWILVACCLLATAFRHNALAATAGLLAGGAFYAFERLSGLKRLLAACFAGVGLSLVLALMVSVFNGLVAKPAHITTALLLFDIGGTVMHADAPEEAASLALSAPAVLTDDPGQFMQNLRRSYSPASASPLVSSRNKARPFSIDVYSADHDARGVASTWALLVRTYPVAYAKHRAKVLACLLQLCDRRQWIFHSYFLNERFAFPDTVQEHSAQWTARKVFLNPKLAWLYTPALWFVLTLVGGVVGFLRRGSSPLLFIALSSLGLLVSLALTAPVESYRYVHWIVLVGWTMVFLAMDGYARRRRIASNGNAVDAPGADSSAARHN